MIRKLACAVAVMVVAVGFVMAEEFTANVTKVDGNDVTYRKAKGKAAKGKAPEYEEAVKASAKGAAVHKSMFNKDTKKVEKGDAVEGGLTGLATLVKDAGDKGVNARITTEGDKVTQILVIGGKKKKTTE